MEGGMGLLYRQDFDPYDLQPGVLHIGMCYATRKREIRVQMGLRLVDTWCWHGESTLDYPGRPSVIIWTLQSRGRQSESEIQWLRWGRRGWRSRRAPPTTLGFEDTGGGHEPIHACGGVQGLSWQPAKMEALALRLWQGDRPTQCSQKGTQLCWPLKVSPVRPMSDFWPIELSDDKSVFF